MNIEGYKQRLQAEEQQLSNRIDRAVANARDLSDEPDLGEWGDASDRDEEKDGQLGEAAFFSNTLKLVRDALKRIEEGTFGKCVIDGAPIEEKRLNALPWTPYCLEHALLLEKEMEKEHPRRPPTL